MTVPDVLSPVHWAWSVRSNADFYTPGLAERRLALADQALRRFDPVQSSLGFPSLGGTGPSTGFQKLSPQIQVVSDQIHVERL